eukprot:m.307248 g.307248  ORF g.307248 m.307248 type:complete len:123 (+) comp55312_c0_seq13:980-1348(+)
MYGQRIHTRVVGDVLELHACQERCEMTARWAAIHRPNKHRCTRTRKVDEFSPVSRSQAMIRPSPPPVTARLQSGRMIPARIQDEWPENLCTGSYSGARNTLTLLSGEPELTRTSLSSRLKVM